jgi:trimethylamine:corrinoid methyltransferase-like protein
MMMVVKGRRVFDLLTEDEIDRIHEASSRILELTGLRIDREDTAKRLVGNGTAEHPTERAWLRFRGR